VLKSGISQRSTIRIGAMIIFFKRDLAPYTAKTVLASLAKICGLSVYLGKKKIFMLNILSHFLLETGAFVCGGNRLSASC
jgi:hypothetical protein